MMYPRLNSVTIGIKTFLRDEQLFNTIHAIRTNLPECQMIIADCGEPTEEKDLIYADLERHGHTTIQLPFDAGFGSMSNAIVGRLERPLLLVGSDDFDFSTMEARQGIEKLESVMSENLKIDIASGRVNNNPYEFFLNAVATTNGVTIWEQKLEPFLFIGSEFPADCDLTVNYSLIRKHVFHNVRWDEDAKIGQGEHGAFFYDCMKEQFKTVYVPGVNINEQKIKNSERYQQYRNRARSPERSCFKKRRIVEYFLGNGQVDYKE